MNNVCACARVRVCACVRECVRARVRACADETYEHLDDIHENNKTPHHFEKHSFFILIKSRKGRKGEGGREGSDQRLCTLTTRVVLGGTWARWYHLSHQKKIEKEGEKEGEKKAKKKMVMACMYLVCVCDSPLLQAVSVYQFLRSTFFFQKDVCDACVWRGEQYNKVCERRPITQRKKKIYIEG